jgi:prolyl 4-hydroxylase
VSQEILNYLNEENLEYSQFFQIHLAKFLLQQKQDNKESLTPEEIKILNSTFSSKYNNTTLDVQYGETISIRSKPVYQSFFNETNTTYIVHYNGTNYCKPKPNQSNNDDTFDDNFLHFDLNVVCTSPRVVTLDNVLSPDECEHIIQVGSYIGLQRSTVTESALLTQDRTSATIWVERDYSPIVDEINRRIADIMHIDERALFINASAESLQLVHYRPGDLYLPHFDYGTESAKTRSITFLMYLNTPQYGGNTSFPNADDSCKNELGYFGIRPKEGSAAFFYNMHPDGNVDPTTRHFGEPPLNNSIKWMTNVWIWDPAFRYAK